MLGFFGFLGLLLAWCACAHLRKQESKKTKEAQTGSGFGMIVAASCGTKNNNASLQSNN